MDASSTDLCLHNVIGLEVVSLDVRPVTPFGKGQCFCYVMKQKYLGLRPQLFLD